MQASSYRFIGKVLIVSAILAVGIKELGPHLSIPATPAVVWGLVLLPTILMGLALLFQYLWQRRQTSNG